MSYSSERIQQAADRVRLSLEGRAVWKEFADKHADLAILSDAADELAACSCDTAEEGIRPCPPSLCDRVDHDHDVSAAAAPENQT